MRIAAHRGTRLHAPENSRQAFVSAYTAGADVLEMDLQMTKDGRVVVSHDGTTDRLTGETARIPDLTLDELRHTAGRFDFSRTFNPFGVEGYAYYRPGRRLLIEEFEDLLDFLPLDVTLLIELKHDSSPDVTSRERFALAVMTALRVRELVKGVVLYSKDPRTLAALRALEPDVRVAAFDYERTPAEQLKLARELGAGGLVTQVSDVCDATSGITPFGTSLKDLHAAGELPLGALLYPYRSPGVFLPEEFEMLRHEDFVWSLSTDSLLGVTLAGRRVEVAEMTGRHWTWIDEHFAGARINRDRFALGYAKANRFGRLRHDDGIHLELLPYDGPLPARSGGSDVQSRLDALELRMDYAERTWPYYSGGGLGLVPGLRGDFIAEMGYELQQPLTQATTLELAAVNIDPPRHREEQPMASSDFDPFFDPHGAPPYVGVEHDEDDGYRINWNLGTEYETNQYGPPVGNGRTPKAGRLRLERRGAYFAAYYRNAVDAPDWICVGVIRNESMNPVVHLRGAGKRWRQLRNDGSGDYSPIVSNRFTFTNVRIQRTSPFVRSREE
jgi:glycerophosphoryl diester phosphodiesterase